MPSPSPRSRRLLAATAGTLSLVLLAGPASAATVEATDPGEAAAGYLLRQLGEDDRLASFDRATEFGITADAVTALVSAGYGRDAVPGALAYLAGGTDADYAQTSAGGTLPGRSGKLAYAFAAAAVDPRDIDGVDLVARIEASLVPAGDPTLPEGRYEEADGANSPTKQALALLGLLAAGATPDASAIDYLLSQQCDAPAAAAGAFSGNAVTPVGDVTTCTSGSTNSTPYAVMALAAAGGQEQAVSDALDWLAANHNDDGGLGFAPGQPTDSATTGLVVQAVLAGGEDPSDGRWVAPEGSAVDALLDLQALSEYTEQPALRGGFFYDSATRSSTDDDFNDPDTFSSSQAALAATGDFLPVAPVAVDQLSADEPVVSDEPATAPTQPTEPTDPSTEPTAGAPTADGGSTGGPATAPDGATDLPVTGTHTGVILPIGLGALVVGGAALLAARPSRRTAGAHRA